MISRKIFILINRQLRDQNRSVISHEFSYFLVSVVEGALFQLTVLSFTSTKATVYSGIVVFTVCLVFRYYILVLKKKKNPKKHLKKARMSSDSY